MTKEQLLNEVADILRSAPPLTAFTTHQAETMPWLGRAFAAIERWDPTKMPSVLVVQMNFRELGLSKNAEGFKTITMLLHQAHADLQMELGRTSVVVEAGQVFQYFEELRRVVETARIEVFFVDRYLDADFVSRYLPFVVDGVSIRLLGRDRMATLAPAVDLFRQESKRTVQVRSSDAIHDRYLFVDRAECHFSGASFKDGAKNSPALISKITDAFQATWDIYERHWNGGKVYGS